MTPRAFLPTHPYGRFLLIGAGLAVLWWIGYGQVLGPDGRLDYWLSAHVARAAAGALHAVGFASATAPQNPTLVTMAGQPAVLVSSPCNGLALYALFAGFVVAYPGRLGRKAWFIPLGTGAVYLLNVLRVAALALNHTYWLHTVDFNHHYTFTFVAYGAILALWRWWAYLGTDVGFAHGPEPYR